MSSTAEVVIVVPPPPGSLPESELVALVGRAKTGDREAFGVLAQHFYRMVSILAYQKVKNRADAEDLAVELAAYLDLQASAGRRA